MEGEMSLSCTHSLTALRRSAPGLERSQSMKNVTRGFTHRKPSVSSALSSPADDTIRRHNGAGRPDDDTAAGRSAARQEAAIAL
jgi:hypothetical protein